MRRFSGRMKLVWHVPAEPPWSREGVQASEVPKSALSLRNPTWSSPTVSRSPSTVWSGTRFPEQIHTYIYQTGSDAFLRYWVTQNLPQICTVILRIRIGKVAWLAVYICGNCWVTQYVFSGILPYSILLFLNISILKTLVHIQVGTTFSLKGRCFPKLKIYVCVGFD